MLNFLPLEIFKKIVELLGYEDHENLYQIFPEIYWMIEKISFKNSLPKVIMFRNLN